MYHLYRIPQIYLKQFGYKDKNEQWKISVQPFGQSRPQQKSIKSFRREVNFFDIASADPVVQRMFEKSVNGVLEDEYPRILNDLETKGLLSDKSYAYVLQLAANLLVRSDHWRQIVIRLLDSPNKPVFLKHIMGHHCQNEEEFNAIHEQPFYTVVLAQPTEKSINMVLLYFMDHIMKRLWDYELVIIQSQEGKPWFTSTDPVVAQYHIDPAKGFEIFGQDSEYYLPLSPSYLAYLHFPGAVDRSNPLRALPQNSIHLATDEQNLAIVRLIANNVSHPGEYLIFPGQYFG